MLYRASSILFQILFEYEYLGKFNRKDFLPWQSEVKNAPYLKIGRFHVMDPTAMYFMRAVPRRDLFRYCLQEHLPTLWFFIKQHLVSRKNRVIPMLE